MPRLGRRRGAVLGLVGALSIAACTGVPTSGPTTTTAIVTTTAAARRADDGVLRIGVLAPRSGEGASIGQALTDAADLAVLRVNRAGGVGGREVELREADEGATAGMAQDAIQSLLDDDVDAVIGPVSSTIALATLGDLLAAGVLTCSPTATALALDAYPDSDLFFRTAPSDSLQATAIGLLAEQTGARTTAVAFLDDSYGRPLADAVIADLGSRGMVVDKQIPFVATDDDLIDEATEIGDSGVGVVVVIGDADEGTRLLAAIGEMAGRFEDPPDIIVNDAMRRPPSAQLVQMLPTDVRERVRGLAPAARGEEPTEPTGPFATNAYDCVNLIALAAVQAGPDDPSAMADQMTQISNSGVACPEFDDCISLLDENRNINYEGPGGVVQIGDEGDPQRARFDVFSFDENGLDTTLRTLQISP